MPGKLRVHELAKQLGVTSKELLATLKEQGEFVKTASSTIEPPVVKKMRAHYEAKEAQSGEKKDKPAASGSSAPKPAAKKSAENKPAEKKPAKPAAPKPGAAAPKPG
ncbi:translation initiation factor IF-2 N-terminal domain-containing protein, partial [Corynebacterium sp. HMSC05E07]